MKRLSDTLSGVTLALTYLAELAERSYYSRGRPETSRALCCAIRRCRFDS